MGDSKATWKLSGTQVLVKRLQGIIYIGEHKTHLMNRLLFVLEKKWHDNSERKVKTCNELLRKEGKEAVGEFTLSFLVVGFG